MAGMTKALNCTRLSGAAFEQQKLITGKKSWQEYWRHLQAEAPTEGVTGLVGGDGEGDCEEECLPMESSDIVYTEV